MKILVSAFETFDNRNVNGSYECMKLLDNVSKVLLPVSFNKAFLFLKKAIDEIIPDIIICLGEAINREEITIEKYAYNIRKSTIVDNDGIIYNGSKVINNGEDRLETNLLINEICMGTKIILSESAGTYVCNDVLYEMLDYIKHKNIYGGFIHIPRIDKYKSYAEMSIEITKLINNIKEKLWKQ